MNLSANQIQQKRNQVSLLPSKNQGKLIDKRNQVTDKDNSLSRFIDRRIRKKRFDSLFSSDSPVQTYLGEKKREEKYRKRSVFYEGGDLFK